MQLLILIALVLALALSAEARLREGECEVCINSVNKFIAEAKKSKAKKVEDYEKVMKNVCKKKSGLLKHEKEQRFCYYIGGSEDAASSALRGIAKPMSLSMPAEKICERLKKKDLAICELSYPKPIDFDQLPKMRTKQLKKILAGWKAKCKGCTSKADYIKRIQELRPKHDPNYEASKEKEEL